MRNVDSKKKLVNLIQKYRNSGFSFCRFFTIIPDSIPTAPPPISFNTRRTGNKIVRLNEFVRKKMTNKMTNCQYAECQSPSRTNRSLARWRGLSATERVSLRTVRDAIQNLNLNSKTYQKNQTQTQKPKKTTQKNLKNQTQTKPKPKPNFKLNLKTYPNNTFSWSQWGSVRLRPGGCAGDGVRPGFIVFLQPAPISCTSLSIFV